MKSMRSACKVSAKKKLSNMRKAYKNGGRTSCGYADGGMVDDDDMMDDPMSDASEELGIEGKKAKSRLDKGKGKTNINIVIAAGKDKPDLPPVVPPLPPVPGNPPLPPMMPNANPMMKHGGRIGYKNGGKIKHAAGGGLGRLEKAKAYGLKPCKGK